MAKELEFIVTGEHRIHCVGCEERISRVLGRLPGVRGVTASADTQRVRVKVNPQQVEVEVVKAKLEALGYQSEAGGVTSHEHSNHHNQ